MPRLSKTAIDSIQKLIDALIKTFGSQFIKQKIRKYIKNKYDSGLIKAEDFFDVNFTRDQDSLKFLNEYADGLVGSLKDDLANDMRGIIKRTQIDGSDIEGVKQRIREEFNSKQYKDRLKVIIRTEGVRAGNTAQMDSAKKMKFKVLKYLDVTLDDRTSDICKEEFKKYGSKDKAIPLNEDFEVSIKNKTYRANAPPFHPNCRSVVMFVEDER